MKHYWIVCWLEKWWQDGTVKGFKTAVHCESLAKAVEIAENELRIRAEANKTEVLLYDIGIADEGVADLIGKAETDDIAIDWPEGGDKR